MYKNANKQGTSTMCVLVCKVKGKGKIHLEQAMKAQRGSRGITLLFP